MLNVALCGCGFVGRIHAKAYSNIKDAQVSGVFDLNQEKSSALAEEIGVKQYTRLAEILSDDSIDIVDVCVPTFLHREFTENSLQADKHVLCEKPIALTVSDAEAMVNAAEKAATLLMIGHTHRFYIENVLVHEAAQAGRLGEVLSCSAYRLGVMPDWSEGRWMANGEKSGGAATDFILHDIDLCNWIGGTPRLVMAQGVRSQTGAWDYMDVSIDYENGVKGFVEGGWMFKGEWPFTQEHRIMGKKGTAQWRSRMGKNIEGRMEADTVVGIFIDAESASFPKWEKRDPFEKEIEYFIGCVSAQKPVETIRPLDALTALKVSLAAKKSAETLKPIKIR
ncbi:MAG: hypothetical protein AMS17_04595 [Spirochaetes bacterium DG_61]|nr:MAG: hypothetical protein AMS17_04595 [Spirochaetes bacterium DG_61]